MESENNNKKKRAQMLESKPPKYYLAAEVLIIHANYIIYIHILWTVSRWSGGRKKEMQSIFALKIQSRGRKYFNTPEKSNPRSD